MSEPKVIAVVGATGAQGSGLVNAILADKSGPVLSEFEQWLESDKNLIPPG